LCRELFNDSIDHSSGGVQREEFLPFGLATVPGVPAYPANLPYRLVALALSLSCGACLANSRMGDAEVQLQDGQPCFYLSPKDVARDKTARLQAITVTDTSTQPMATVWWVMFDADPAVPQSAAACYPYGQLPSAAKSGNVEALKNGKVYSAFLNVRGTDKSDPTRGYSVRFCLAGEGATRRLIPAEAWRNGVCN